MKRVVIEPEAADDLREAVDWYGRIGDAVRLRFIGAVDEAIVAARDRPGSFPFAHSTTRRVLLKRFPYALLFQDRAEATLVLGVLHTSMDPTRASRRAR